MINENRFVIERKWKLFGYEISDYLKQKLNSVFITHPRIIIPKHFADRVMDRLTTLNQHVVKAMLYHVIDNNLCELLFWYKGCPDKTLDIIDQDFRITLIKNKYGDIICKTIWYGEKHRQEDEVLMQIYLKKTK